MTRKQIGAVLGAVVLAAAAPFLTLAVLHVLDGTAQANPDTITVGFDMYPTGNGCPGDGVTDCTLGPVDKCVAVPPGGGLVDFDIYLDDLPSGEKIRGWDAKIDEKTGQTVGPITAYAHANTHVNLVAQVPGSAIMDLSDPTGTVVPVFEASVLDFQVLASEANPPFSQGGLGRYTIDTTGLSDGVYRLTLDNVSVFNHLSQDLCVTHTCDIKDAYDDYGLIAVGVPCPGAADLEKFDLFVRPFYCGDTDMDGDEATGNWVPLGTGTCCDGVDNDGNTLTDGQDPKCQPHINEDPLDDVDNDGDGYEGEDRPLPPGEQCPWNGDDDCDGLVDEDPKNGIDDRDGYVNDGCPAVGNPESGAQCANAVDDDGEDGLIDEDPANGFLGIDNDRDGAIDEDGGGRFDWNGDTEVDAGEEQFEGVDDDGDTRVDEDPLDSPAKLWIDGQPKLHEAHYLVEEVLLNYGPTSPVTALDTTELDAPAYRADLKEDGFTTCNDNLNNDGDAIDGCDVDGCPGIPNPDPQCLNEHIGEEAAGLHACNDGKDNGAGWGLGDNKIDEGDPDDCGTVSEVSVECKNPTDLISIKDGVPWYIKPPSNSPLTQQYCPQYFDPAHSNKCVPCKIPMGAGPVDDMPCMAIMPPPWQPGYCVAADSKADVENELELHRPVTLTTGVEVIDEQQLDVACDEWTSLHPFSIYNVLEPPEDITDPLPGNNQKGTRMLVACTAYTHGYLTDLSGPDPPVDVYVTAPAVGPVSVYANNGESSPQEFIVTLEAQSPGLGIGGPEGLKDADTDGWADNVEGLLRSDPENKQGLSTPESIHVPGSCSDGDDNDLMWGKDAADPKCVDTDGDGYSDGEEWMFGSSPLDPDKTPEHMQLPWTCYDFVDNDDDGQSENAEGDGPDTDGWGDCSIDQLTAIRPPVMCASGWQSPADRTYDITLAPNGDLTVAINIPVAVAPGASVPVNGELVFNCFQPGDYPPQTILASIEPANPHVVDLLPTEPLQTSFTGTATCVGGEADLQVKDWMFGPAPSYILPLEEWEDWDTAKEIYNAGPDDAEQVRVRKEMNLPAQSCHGYVTVAYAGETIGIAEGALYSFNDLDWYFGPAELVEGTDVSIDEKVYVADPFGAVPAITPELSAWFLLPDPIPVGATAYAEEAMGVWCWQVGDYPFFFSNQVTLVGYPNVCDPSLGNISMDLVLEAHARDCSVTGDTDYDSFADNVECYLETDPLNDCPEKTGSPGKCPGVDCDGDDAWPLDINIDKFVTMADVFKYAGRLNETGGPPPSAKWLKRLDLNKDNWITMADVFKYNGKLNQECS